MFFQFRQITGWRHNPNFMICDRLHIVLGLFTAISEALCSWIMTQYIISTTLLVHNILFNKLWEEYLQAGMLNALTVHIINTHMEDEMSYMVMYGEAQFNATT